MNLQRKILFALIITGCICSFFSFSNREYNRYNEITNSDTTKNSFYLELKGNVRQSKVSEKDESKALDSALITIYTGDIPFSETWTNKKGKCSFKLPLGKQFRIEVSKSGFVSKLFDVDTKVPSDKKDTYTFSFDIDIFEEIPKLDVSVLKKPIAKVSYNIIMEQFAYDISYTSKINLELKKMYKNYYLLQKIESDSLAKTTLSHPEKK
ncbi:MAG: hypothetical protein J0L87_06550 [Bacteroidetes bacterium]|nr:hypothetical protein [Bacteroidota bacterium]